MAAAIIVAACHSNQSPAGIRLDLCQYLTYLQFRQPADFTRAHVVNRAHHLDLPAVDEIAGGRTGKKQVLNALPYVFFDSVRYNVIAVHARVFGHGPSHCRFDIVNQGRDVAFEGVTGPQYSLCDRRYRTALGMTQDNKHGRIYVGQPILDRSNLVHIAHVACHADDKDVHDPGVK